MCEQAARYCRDGVHKLLNKEQGKLRAQDSREQPQPVAGQDSESATAAQSGNSGAQPGGGIDGLVRWIVTKMSDNKNIASREFASSKEEVAVAQEQFFAPEPRRGISVILDVSVTGGESVRVGVGGGGCWFVGGAVRCGSAGRRGRRPVSGARGPVQCAPFTRAGEELGARDATLCLGEAPRRARTWRFFGCSRVQLNFYIHF